MLGYDYESERQEIDIELDLDDPETLRCYVMQNIVPVDLLYAAYQRGIGNYDEERGVFGENYLKKLIITRAQQGNEKTIGYHTSSKPQRLSRPDEEGRNHFALQPDKLCIRGSYLHLVEVPKSAALETTNAELGWYTSRSELKDIAALPLGDWDETFGFRQAQGYIRT